MKQNLHVLICVEWREGWDEDSEWRKGRTLASSWVPKFGLS